MSDEINEGIRVLVERIKTHPEEFFDEYGRTKPDGKWRTALDIIYQRRNGIRSMFNDDELELVDTTIRKVERARFTTQVLSILFEDDPKRVTNQYYQKPKPKLMGQGVMLCLPPSPQPAVGDIVKNTGR